MALAENRDPFLLLISGGGLLGSILAREFPRLGVSCESTSRGNLDLEKPLGPQIHARLESRKFSHAVLCAAMSVVDDCFLHPEQSRRVNVEAPRELLGLLKEAKIKPIFISTDLVFDCSSGFRREEDPIGPMTLYAHQKAETESLIRKYCGDALIFRISKVMTMDLNPRSILTPIMQTRHGGTVYSGFRDQFITPVFAEDIARAIAVSMRKNLAGTYHLAGPEQFSRFDLGLTTARELGLDLSKIIGGFLSEATFLEPRGSYNSLCSEKFQREAGFEFTPLSKGLEVLRSLL